MKESSEDLIEIAEFDAFTHFIKQSIAYIEKNRQKILIGTIIFFIAIATIVGGYSWISKQKSLAALELQKSVRMLSKAQDINEKKLTEIFKPVTSKYKNYKAAGFANLTIARKLYSINEKKKSIKYFKLAKEELSSSKFISDIIDYELAMAIQPDKNTKSNEYFNKVIKDKSFLDEDALFQLSLKGDKKALKKLKQKDFSTGFYADLIKENI